MGQVGSGGARVRVPGPRLLFGTRDEGRDNEMMRRTRLPQAYAMALWLQELELDDAQVSYVLRIGADAVPSVLRMAHLMVSREPATEIVPGEPRRGVLVFLDDIEVASVDEAIGLVRKRESVLHLVARPSRNARQVVEMAQRVFASGVNVVGTVARASADATIDAITAEWGPVTLMVDRAVAGEVER